VSNPEPEINFKKRLLVLLPGSILYLLTLFCLYVLELQLPELIIISAFILSYLLVGADIIKTALSSLFKGRAFDEFFLMTVATIGALAIQAYPEAVAVMLFFKIGELFQEAAVNRSKGSITALMGLRPDFARVKRNNEFSEIDPAQVEVGETIEVRPGERVPLDGQVISGRATVDTSALTGESRPREINIGEEILSGMVNISSVVRLKASKPFCDSTVSTILNLVQNAATHKAPTEQFITKFARYYTPVVVLAAAIIAIGPILLYQLPFGSVLFQEAPQFSDWLYRGLIFLVISCPCALVVSIPLGFFGGIGLASRKGILVKGGNFLEALNSIKTIVWDKTGTLTQGEFKVSQVTPAQGFTQEELLEAAALGESHSSHPIALSILKTYGQPISQKPESYEEITGCGVSARFENRHILVGNSRLMKDYQIYLPDAAENDHGLVHVAIDNNYAGSLNIEDSLKQGVQETVSELKNKGVKKQFMLTGDNEGLARGVASGLNLDNVYSQLLPQEKVSRLEDIMNSSQDNKYTVYVGDGINDAPVLARSDVGVAMGGLGSDAAIEAADIVLMEDNPEKLLQAIQVAKRTRQIVWQNIILAFTVKVFVLGLGTLGMATMWEAVFADVGVALLAILNSVRLQY
jgi:Cd2+/Zn2+-exporting ATPase